MKKLIPLCFYVLMLVRPAAGQWTEIPLIDANGFNAQNMQFFAEHEGRLYVGSFNQGLYVSDDDGATWRGINEGLDDISVRGITHREDDMFVLLGGFGPYRSTDEGETWTAPGPGLPDFYPSFSSVGTFEGSVFAGTASNHGVFGVWRSDDDGATWTSVGDITVAHAIYAIFGWDGHLYVGTNRGAYRSDDKGDTWTPLQNGLPGNSYVRKFIPVGDHLIALADDGVYLSTDGGDSWTIRSEGFPSFNGPSGLAEKAGKLLTVSAATIYAGSASDLKFAEHSDEMSGSLNLLLGISGVYAAANNRFWRSPLSDYGISTVGREMTGLPGSFQLDQNYPNPFNPTTDISYTIPEASEVTLIFYDLAGREQARLAGGFQAAGTYTVSFDAAGMATGSYVYRLSAGDHTQTRLMTLLK